MLHDRELPLWSLSYQLLVPPECLEQLTQNPQRNAWWPQYELYDWGALCHGTSRIEAVKQHQQQSCKQLNVYNMIPWIHQHSFSLII